MSAAIETFPGQPAAIQTVVLDGESFRVRLTWRRRCRAWYLDLWTLDMTPLALGRRLSAQWMPLLGYDLPAGPAGYLYVRGSDGYVRGDIGSTLQLRYFTLAEVQALNAARTAAPSLVIEV